LKNQDEMQRTQSTGKDDSGELLASVPSAKRKYIEPAISDPVDVLEATTFFQAVDSGPTN
jgi:hypothetical protein